jgi:hypothetical protein
VASAWDCGGVFRLEVRGAAAASPLAGPRGKWLRVASVPDLFRPFAGWFVDGLAGSGGRDAALAGEAVFASIVNMARGSRGSGGGGHGPPRQAARRIPHWRRLSCTKDVWCMKRLGGGHADGWDWARSAPAARSIFVDPREV